MSVAAIKMRYLRAQQVPSSKAEIVQVREFVDVATCEALIELIDAKRRPSTIADDNGDPLFRTSETCDLYPVYPVVAALDAELSATLGIAPGYGEIMQGQRYAPGQEFKAHNDWFNPDGIDYERYCTEMGQRTWTAMIYLNVPAAGGATRFKLIDKMFQPETGKLLCWNNLHPDGRANASTLHHGMKVRRGTKYIVTKWFRERQTGFAAP